VVLDRQSLSSGAIVLPRDAAVPVRHAARELVAGVRALTGCSLRTTPDVQDDAEGVRFLLGSTRSAASLVALTEDELEVRVLGDRDILLRGGGSRGVLYAVYELLDHWGCRWYHSDVFAAPQRCDLTIPEPLHRTPTFEYREALWKSAVDDPVWSARNRLNGSFHKLRPEHGRGWGWHPFVHTFHTIVPPDQFGTKHREYFSLRRGQGRIAVGAQLCLSNPDVLQLAIDFVLERMSDPNTRIVDVSQNDCVSPCECAGCTALDAAGGGPSASLIHFVNRIAEETCRHYPDKYVGTLAYTYTQRPPTGMRVHPNVIVRLCHMVPSCDVHPLASCARNRYYVKCVRDWTAISSRVYVWHYVTNFRHYLLFHPNLDALGEDIRFYHQLGVKGIFFQGQTSPGLSFAEMHAFAQARLAWDSSRDYLAEVHAFIRAFYGPAAVEITELLEVLHDNVRRGHHATLQSHPAEGVFTPSQLQKAADLICRARDLATDDAALENRLAAVQLWCNYSRLTSVPPLRKTSCSFQVTAAPDAPRLLSACRDGMTRLGIPNIHEFPALHQDLTETFGWSLTTRDLSLLTLANAQVRVEMAPDLAGMVCTFLDRDTGRDLFAKPAPWMPRYPYIGGFTEGRTNGGFASDFWTAYQVDTTETTTERIVLRADLGDGVHVRRCVWLHGTRPAFVVESTYTNRGAVPVRVQPYTFVIWALGELQDIRFFACRGNRLEPIANAFPADGTVATAQWVNLRGAAVPRGRWGLFNLKLGFGATDDFGRLRPRVCASNAYLRDNRILTEVLFAPRILASGGERTVKHTCTVIREFPCQMTGL